MNINISIGIFILRLSAGILMLMHGVSKITHGIGGIVNMLEDSGIPRVLGYGVYIGEILAPLLLIVGYKTRIAAVIFTINCLVAMILVHSEDILSIGKHGNWGVELLGLYLFSSLALFFTGGGKIAVSVNGRWD